MNTDNKKSKNNNKSSNESVEKLLDYLYYKVF